MNYKLQWTWFSQAQGVADIYLTTQVNGSDFILWNSSNKHFSYVLAEKIDAEIERLGLPLDGRGIREMMKIYNSERLGGQNARWAAEKAGIIGAKMRNGWKKSIPETKIPAGEILEEIGLDLNHILRAQ
jgi:hypothetical protein